MHITLESDYATRIAYCLAKAPGRMDAKSISEETGVTLRFSLKILRKLVASGIVKSFKGEKGSLFIALGGVVKHNVQDYVNAVAV